MEELPNCFAIERDENHSLWDKLYEWLKSDENEFLRGFSVTKNNGTIVDVITTDLSLCNGKEIPDITLKQWNEIVNK